MIVMCVIMLYVPRGRLIGFICFCGPNSRSNWEWEGRQSQTDLGLSLCFSVPSPCRGIKMDSDLPFGGHNSQESALPFQTLVLELFFREETCTRFPASAGSIISAFCITLLALVWEHCYPPISFFVKGVYCTVSLTDAIVVDKQFFFPSLLL